MVNSRPAAAVLVVVDVGNTNTVFGIYRGDDLVADFRLSTDTERTADEYGAMLLPLFGRAGIDPASASAVIVSSVVPPLNPTLARLSETFFGHRPLFVEPGVRTGMQIRYDNPAEVGADRIVNAVAAYEKFKTDLIVVDFGTATTFDVISGAGEYLGGAIIPGIEISLDALFGRAAALRRVELVEPRSVIGKTTVESIQSGVIYGYSAMIDGMCDRIEEVIGEATVIATGGLGGIVIPHCRREVIYEKNLLLNGLWELYQKNKRKR